MDILKIEFWSFLVNLAKLIKEGADELKIKNYILAALRSRDVAVRKVRENIYDQSVNIFYEGKSEKHKIILGATEEDALHYLDDSIKPILAAIDAYSIQSMEGALKRSKIIQFLGKRITNQKDLIESYEFKRLIEFNLS